MNFSLFEHYNKPLIYEYPSEYFEESATALVCQTPCLISKHLALWDPNMAVDTISWDIVTGREKETDEPEIKWPSHHPCFPPSYINLKKKWFPIFLEGNILYCKIWLTWGDYWGPKRYNWNKAGSPDRPAHTHPHLGCLSKPETVSWILVQIPSFILLSC